MWYIPWKNMENLCVLPLQLKIIPLLLLLLSLLCHILAIVVPSYLWFLFLQFQLPGLVNQGLKILNGKYQK